MTFFFDNNFSPRLVAGLRALGQPVAHLREHFDLITRDKRIRNRPAQVAALRRADVGAFIFTQQRDLNFWDWVETVVRRWREIERWARSHGRPFVAGIPERGKFRTL